MKIPEKYQAIAKALEGDVSPGPWRLERHTSGVNGKHDQDDDWTVYGNRRNHRNPDLEAAIMFEGTSPSVGDPEYLASVDPDTIKQMLEDACKYHEIMSAK